MLTVIEKVLLLQEVEFFRFAYTEHLSQAAQIAKEVRVSRETILFREGEKCALFNLLISGQVALESAGRIFQEVSRGPLEFWAFFSELPHQLTGRALEECLLLTIPYEDMVDLLTAEPEFCWAIARQLAHSGSELAGLRIAAETS